MAPSIDPVVHFYDVTATGEEADRFLDICADLGMDVDDLTDKSAGTYPEATQEFYISYQGWQPNVVFIPGSDYKPDIKAFLNAGIDPARSGGAEYGEWMDVVFGLLCRVSIALEA